MPFSPELEALLVQAEDILKEDETVVLVFDDMVEVNDHFQAVEEWFRDRGWKKGKRNGTGIEMTTGWLYFAGRDTLYAPIRGVKAEIDLQPYAHELIRKVGLEARLREKGVIS